MKCAILLTACLAVFTNGEAAKRSTTNQPTNQPTTAAETPMAKVVTLLAALKSRVIADGAAEQKSYDKYACWCEDTLGRKAADISDGKTSIEELTALIVKTKAELASHTAGIAQLKKQIKSNVESQREASEVRNKEATEYAEEKSESENCIGALEAAIKVLAGAGGKKSFLGTLQEAQLLGVVDGIKGVLKTSAVKRQFTDAQIEAVEKFAETPEDYVGGHSSSFSAAQVSNNPFGDYAPQSTQIQGILKGMYDTFTGDLEKDNADEAEKQKSFELLIETKKLEAATLEASLERTELDAAEATKLLADSKGTLDDTKETLDADETFFTDAKESCKTKSASWSQRTRLRTEELSGMAQAIAILSSPEAQKTFQNATTTFLQVASISIKDRETKAYLRVKQLAKTSKSMRLAKLALAIKTSGHFDNVITMIDTMIGMMRQEEAEDITHRDRCENKQNANENAKDDLNSEITKTKEALARMGNTEEDLKKQKTAIEDEIKKTKDAIDELLNMRNKEEKDFTQALKDDADAVALLGQAIAALSKFYEDNKAAALVQKAPEYANDPNKAPETSFDDGNYGGAKSETGGVVAILGMLKEDLMKEMQTGKADDAEAQATYERDNAALEDTLEAQEKKKVGIETEFADLGAKIEGVEEDKENKDSDLSAEEDVAKSLATDCAWVKNTFEARRQKRKLEMDGLVEAKDFLAGVDSGAAVLAPVSTP